MNKSREELIEKFHKAFGVGINEKPTVKVLELRKALINEEAKELSADIDKAVEYLKAKKSVPKALYANMLKELADLQVVLSGTSVALKPLRRLEDAFRLVHASNMSKLDKNGKPILREDGKVLKGPNYFEPDLSDLI